MIRISQRWAFTLVEILIVVVILAILAAAVIPQFTDSTGDAKESTAQFNLSALRSQIALYKAQHGDLGGITDETSFTGQLTTQTNVSGKIYGPYFSSIPANPKSTNPNQSQVTVQALDPAASELGKPWVYSTTTGRVFRGDDISK